MTDKHKIFHFLCPSFHGSSVLCQLLNNHSQVRAIADGNPPRQKWICLCGQFMEECEFWNHIKTQTQYSDDELYKHLIPAMPYLVKSQPINAKINHILCHLGLYLGPFVWGMAGKEAVIFQKKYESYTKAALGYYQEQVLVDAAKHYLKTFCWLSMGGQLDGVVHLVRDPRAYVLSAIKGHQSDNIIKHAKSWLLEHRKIEHYLQFLPPHKVLTLKYEDFVSDSKEQIRNLFDFLGVSTENVFHEPDISQNHMLGNSSIRNFAGNIYPNEKWKDALSTAQQKKILKITKPLSTLYGYE